MTLSLGSRGLPLAAGGGPVSEENLNKTYRAGFLTYGKRLPKGPRKKSQLIAHLVGKVQSYSVVFKL